MLEAPAVNVITNPHALVVHNEEPGKVVLTSFADGDSIRDSWDGRSREKRFEYLGPAPAVTAQLDPERVLLLDLNQTNNGRTLAPASGTAGTRWAGRWLLWMEDALLTYASLL
jgi:hypothetical protein